MTTMREPFADTSKRYLNLGCGSTFRPGWVNMDFHDHGGAVLAYDLRLGIPFARNTFDVVYHSHLLEHFTRKQGRYFLEECFRVLRPGGMVRVVVPDLENIVRAYLAALSEAEEGLHGAAERHEWMTVELLDQMVRDTPGGEMAAFWRREPVPQEEFIVSRAGQEYARFRQTMGRDNREAERATPLPLPDADFCQSGENHRWMYDKVSLSGLLEKIGFTNITRQSHQTSLLPEIIAYGLDCTSHGAVRKPDSFFLEAVKPPDDGASAKELKVALFSTSDCGGAGTAALRLHKSLANVNVTPQMYVAAQRTRTKSVYVCPVPGQTVVPLPQGGAALSGWGAAEKRNAAKLARYPGRPKDAVFFSSTEQCADLDHLPFNRDFDVLHLHWIANFLDPGQSHEALRGRPLVWTLHDMRPFTGGCHYADGCRKFTEHCGACPQLGSNDPQDISFQNWRHAMTACRKLDLHIVTPSKWLAEEAGQSSLFKRFPVSVIPYAQPLDVFRPMNREAVRRTMGLGQEELVLAFSAQSLTEKRKGMHYLVECLQALAQGSLRDAIRIVLLGNNPADVFFRLGLKVSAAGHIDSPEQMALLYNAADAVMVPSLEDNSPNVICEAAGCGVPVVAFAAGGIPEMVKHKETGWLAAVGDVSGLVQGVEWVNSCKGDHKVTLRCRALALELWNPSERARGYAELYARLCRKE